MSINKVSLKGLDKLLSSLAAQLKNKEDQMILKNQLELEESEPLKIESETLLQILNALASTKSLDPETLENSISLYKIAGYSEEEIQGLLGSNLQNILELYESFLTLQELRDKGIILNAKIRKTQ